MGRDNTYLGVVCLLAFGSGCMAPPAAAPARQNPSPMVEHTRAHERIAPSDHAGVSFTLDGHFDRPIEVFVEAGEAGASPGRLLIHFHGAGFIPAAAIHEASDAYVLAAVHLGAGSAVYERAFTDHRALEALMEALRDELARRTGRPAAFAAVTLSAFSAGYGAVRAILRHEANAARIDDVILLDGLHTGYLPDATVLAEGGRLNADELAPFVAWARAAVRGEKGFLITHSEIFPGTFASTTETTDYVIQALGLRRTPVLRWGPLGMQQLSEVREGNFVVLGFAGNTAPDHVDHLHAFPALLAAGWP